MDQPYNLILFVVSFLNKIVKQSTTIMDFIRYACVNLGEAWAPREIAERAICLDGDIGEVLQKLK